MNFRLTVTLITFVYFNMSSSFVLAEPNKCEDLLADIHFFEKLITSRMVNRPPDLQEKLIHTVETNNFLLMANMAQDVYRDNSCPLLIEVLTT